MRILISGSRKWTDKALIEMILSNLNQQYWRQDITMVSGHAPRGADKMCEEVAVKLGWKIEKHPAKWKDENGRLDMGAGMRRNNEMVKLGADLCVAFILDGSPGSSHTAKKAKQHGIKTLVYEKTSK